MARVELNIVALGDFKSVNSQIKALQDQVNLLNKSVASVGVNANLTKQLNEANAAFKSTLLSTGQFTASTVRLKAETEKFGEALVGGKLKLTQYFQIIKAGSTNATAQMRALAMEQTKLQNSMVMSDPTKQGVLSIFTPTKINAVTNATKIAANTQNLYNLAVDKGTQSLINWGKNTQWAGRQLTVGMTVPLTIFGTTAMKVFKEVNDEIVRLQKVYGTGIQQPTQAALAAIKDDVLKLSKELASGMGIAVKDTAAMAADLAATGLQGNDLIGATRESIRLQKLGEMDQQDAMQTTISLQNVYKLSTNQLSGAIDFLNAVENQTSTSMQDLAAGIPKVGPIVQQLGGSFQDTALMMVAMKEAGVPAAQSANAIKSALASLINPTRAAKDAFAAYNINLSSIATKTGGNPVQMIMMLQDALKGLAPLAQAQLIDKLFGKYQQARIQALISNLGSATSQTRQAFDLMNASEAQLKGIAAGELKVATESTTGKFRRAVETMKADLLPVGEKIMQVATTLLNFGNSVAKVFGGLPGPVKTVLGIVAAGVALSGPIIMFTGVLANFVGYLIKGLFSMKDLINGTKTFGQLFTPEIIASQNAAQLFSQKILQDESAVMLLNKAVRELTISLEGMAMGMAAASGTGLARKLLVAEAGLAGGRIPFKAPKMATGGYVPGSPSAGDVYPALLQGGEAVIPTRQAQQYAPFINAMIKGVLPGHEDGVLAHMRGNFSSGDKVYEDYMKANPDIEKFVKEVPGAKVSIMSNLAARIPHSLNSKFRDSSATESDIKAGFQSPLAFGESAGKGGLSSTELDSPETRKALKDFQDQVRRRAQALARVSGQIGDPEMDRVTRDVIERMKKLGGASTRVAKALDTAGSTFGGSRVFLEKEKMQAAIDSGIVTRRPGQKSKYETYGQLMYGTGQVGEYGGSNPDRIKDRNINSYASTSPTYKAALKKAREAELARELNVASRSQPFANSPKFQSKIDLSGPSGSMARSSGSYIRTNNLILDRIKRDEALAKELNTASESASPSKATKRAAKNMVDGVTEGIRESKSKVKAAANNAMEESLLANAGGGEYTNLATETEPGLAATSRSGGRFAKFNEKRMAARTKLQSRMPKMMTGRFSGLGMGLGLQMAQQFGGKYIDKLPGGDVANSAITGASYGAFLGPEGAAAGAVIGGLIGGISKLINVEKAHEASAKATFSASTSAATIFKSAIVDAGTPVISLGNLLDKTVPKAATLKTETESFVAAIKKLPENDPLSVILTKIQKSANSGEASKIASAFAATQMAINGMDPIAAQKMIDLLLSAGGKGGSANAGSLGQSVTKTLNSVETSKPKTPQQEKVLSGIQDRIDQYAGATYGYKAKRLEDAKKDLQKWTAWIDAENNKSNVDIKTQQGLIKSVANETIGATTPFKTYQERLDGVKKSTNDTNVSLKKYADSIKGEKGDLPKYTKLLADRNLTLSQALPIMALMSKNQKSPLIAQIMEASANPSSNSFTDLLGKIGKELSLIPDSKPGAIKPGFDALGNPLSAEEIAANKASALQKKYKSILDLDQKRITALERQKKLMDDQNSAAQDAISYATQQTDFQNQIRKAMAGGDYLQANLLRQQLAGNADKYNQTVISNKNTQLIDTGRQIVADAQTKLASGKDLSKAEIAALKNYNPKLGTYQVGSVNMPSAVQYGSAASMGSGAGAQPIVNMVFNDTGKFTQEQLQSIVDNAFKKNGVTANMSGVKSKVGG